MRILLVDDDQDTVEAICLYLEQCGADVTVATSAVEALATVNRTQPHVVVSDVAMPDMDGLELIRRIRAEGNQVPALAFTGSVSESDRRSADFAGFDDHVSKPIDPAALVQRIVAVTNWKPRA